MRYPKIDTHSISKYNSINYQNVMQNMTLNQQALENKKLLQTDIAVLQRNNSDSRS